MSGRISSIMERGLTPHLPISVVVPHDPRRRRKFFKDYCLPSIKANRPAQIFVDQESGTAPKKRNRTAARCTEPYVIFVDDDVILGASCLEKMFYSLELVPEAGYTYCDYLGVVHLGIIHHMGGNFLMKSAPFDAARLKEGNYISGVSLMRREIFPGWNEELERLQDWDLWLRLEKKGIRGQYIEEVLFQAHYIDQGVTEAVSLGEAINAIRKEHGL